MCGGEVGQCFQVLYIPKKGPLWNLPLSLFFFGSGKKGFQLPMQPGGAGLAVLSLDLAVLWGHQGYTCQCWGLNSGPPNAGHVLQPIEHSLAP